MSFKSKGFTLIELLVVIAIIGLLSTLAVVSFGNARQKSRDAKRISDIKSIQTALELYFGDTDAYPVGASITLGTASSVKLSSGGGFSNAAGVSGTEYMTVPKDPDPAASGGAGDYIYNRVSTTDYDILFKLEAAAGSLAAGTHTGAPSGIQ